MEKSCTARTLRVGVVTTSFPLKTQPYSGIFIARLLRALPQNVGPCVVVPAGNNGEGVEILEKEVEIHPFRYAPWRYQLLARQPGGVPVALSGNKWIYLLIPTFLLSMAITCLRVSRHIDLFHANWSVAGMVAGIVGRLVKKPVLTTLRGEDVNRAETSLIYATILKAALLLSHRVIVVSDAIGQALRAKYPDHHQKIAMIPNGVESDLLDIQRTGNNVGSRSLSLLAVGALIKRKAVNNIIEALSYINVSPPPSLTVVGDGPELRYLERLAKEMNVYRNVNFIGAVDPDDVQRYLSGADIFVFASLSEGRPNVILEAMAAGLPIVASRIDGVTELIVDGRNGMLFAPGDARELAQKLEALIEGSVSRSTLGASARNYIVENKLTWSQTGRRYVEMYEQCLAENKSRRPT